MSQKCVATRSSSRLKTQKLGGERGGEDEGSQNQGQGQGPLDAVLAPTTKDEFMATDDFMRLLRGYVDVAELFHIFRLVSKLWQRIAEEKIDQDFRRGVLAFHGGNDMGVGGDEEFWDSLRAKREPVTRVIFLLNITKVGRSACAWAVNLVVVDIPEGVESISYGAFCQCHRLTTVSFPTTLILIGESAFAACSSLENIDLLHTNLQEFGDAAFWSCSELKSMRIPDSLQTLGKGVFLECSKLVPSNIHVSYDSDGDVINTTSDDVAHLRFQQRFAELEKMLAECDAENAALTTEVATLTTEIAALTTKVAALKIANAPAHTNDFMSTIDFKRHFVGFVHIEMLLVLRELVPSSIDVSGGQNNDATYEVVTHLRSQQQNASS
ncbi:hypothetical protein TrLO_g14502 [Triparma laevis f. longispina]|uniref:Leucine-rich repeat domain, L domain-like n=1 Tax=Triparma laevis f. longispina TaxID=1714387 RepID=A0A9W7A8Z2_9STRA|nr:hypothetical protein TrLO_g14502 [Triparma laevis f. longispina]